MALNALPFGFWFSLGVLFCVVYVAWTKRREPWAIPCLAVCGTVFAWYHCDALYNDYQTYSARFPAEAVDAAWWEVTEFLLCFVAITPALYRQINRRAARQSSRVFALIEGLNSDTSTKRLMRPLLGMAFFAWMIIVGTALVRTEFDFQGLFMPWVDHVAQPWARNRIGGQMDFLVSLLAYIDVFCLACFGIVAALSEDSAITISSLVLIALSWPAVFLDRTRNTMLAVLVPGLLCLVFVRFRRRIVLQTLTVLVGLSALSIWFSFVIAHRANETIVQALANSSVGETIEVKHDGLNMFEELCWINALVRNGAYAPNWGARYFAELANFVPRALWPGKPLIGFDYAIARGYGTTSTSDGIHASIATGMIGQGVVNFGPLLGPLAAAMLVSLWAVALAQFDLNLDRFGRLPLYFFAVVLTFNLGRDVTLLTIYPLLFGYVLIHILEKYTERSRHSAVPRPITMAPSRRSNYGDSQTDLDQ